MDLHAEDPFAICFEHASGATAERFQNPLYKATEPLISRKFGRSVRTVKEFGQSIVSRAVENRNSSGIEKEGEESMDMISGSLINSLLDSIDDHQIVADAALNYLSAGMICCFYFSSKARLTIRRAGHHRTRSDMDILHVDETSRSCRKYSE